MKYTLLVNGEIKLFNQNLKKSELENIKKKKHYFLVNSTITKY
jgi:hypothetical protein